MQQTPWAQNPDAHWASDVQPLVIGSFPQLPITQELGAAQSAVVVQVFRQATAPQAKGEQEEAVTV